MPFTFSHPAIVLPATYLPKKWYSLSALIMGSMTPDFEYFIRMKDESKYGHTWTGVFWFDIPTGLLLIFLFHNVVRNTLISYLPFILNIRFSAFEKFNWNQYFRDNKMVVLISLFFGIASHLIWDDFTHNGGFFVEAIPFLNSSVNMLNQMVPVYSILQYGCSLLGGIVMVIAVFKLPEGKNTKQNIILHYWLLVTIVMITVISLRLYIGQINNHQVQLDDLIVTIISGGLIGITVISFLLKQSKRQILSKELNRIRNK
jgi:hypothetical protein